ncbi:MAG: phospholipid carrier-dependent glycosyltransferase, partial [Acidobacteriota bacterium]
MTHLAIHAAALLVMGLAVGLPGYALERVCIGRSLDDDDALRPLARWVLGLLFWTVALFALASTGLLRTSTLLAVTALGAAAGAWARLRIPRDPPAEGGSQGGDEAAGGGSKVAGWILGFTVVATFLVPFLLAIGPTVSWDGSAYHLTLPRLYLEHGGFRPVEMNVYAAWPQAVELLFAPALAAGGPPFAKLVHFGFGLLVLFGLRTAARRSGLRPWAGWLAMVLFLANGVVLYELRVAYVDLAHAFFLLAAFLFLGAARRNAESRPALLVLAGLAAGLMAGVKITGIAGAALLLALWLPELVRRGRRRRDLGELALRYVLPVALLWLPWLVRSAVLTGNPVYPLAFGAFGGPDWSHELGQRFADWQRGLGMGRGAVDYILLLPRVILVSGQGYDRFDGELGRFWILALPLAVAFVRSSPVIRRCLGISALYFVYWGLSSQQARFLVPILPLVALASA